MTKDAHVFISYSREDYEFVHRLIVDLQKQGVNVWEWVSSINKPYPYDGADGRENSEGSNSLRVLRGGSFTVDANNTRAANRLGDNPSDRGEQIGFRCVRSY